MFSERRFAMEGTAGLPKSGKDERCSARRDAIAAQIVGLLVTSGAG
jgi:hypothetical protein